MDFPTIDAQAIDHPRDAAPAPARQQPPINPPATEVVDTAEVKGGKALVRYSRTEAALAQLRRQYQGAVFDLTTTKGNQAARAARLALVTLRTDLERKRKELKAPALEFGKLIDSEAKRLTEEIETLERPIDAQIKADEARRQAEREKEAARQQGHRDRIEKINRLADGCRGRSTADLDRAILVAESIPTDEAAFEEFAPQATTAKQALLAALHAERAVAQAREDEAARLQAQREEQERRDAELRAREAALAAKEAHGVAVERFSQAMTNAIIRCGVERVQDALPDVGNRTAGFTAEELDQHSATLEALQPIAPDDTTQGAADGGRWREVEPCAFGFGTVIERVPQQEAMGGPPSAAMPGGEAQAGRDGTPQTPANDPPVAPTLTTDAINDRLGLILTSDFIVNKLGIEADGLSKSKTPMWREAKFRTLCAALAEHVLAVAESHA